MKIYDVYQGQNLKAFIQVHEDGHKEWDFSPDDEWQRLWTRDASEDIERAIDRHPNQEFTLGGLTIRPRPD